MDYVHKFSEFRFLSNERKSLFLLAEMKQLVSPDTALVYLMYFLPLYGLMFDWCYITKLISLLALAS